MGEDLFGDSPGARRVGRGEVSVLNGSRLRYSLHFEFEEVTCGVAIFDYRFTFEPWKKIEDTRRLLVYEKRIEGQRFRATVKLQPTGARGCVVDALVDATRPLG